MKSACILGVALVLTSSVASAEPKELSSTVDPGLLNAYRGYVLQKGFNCPVAKVLAHYPDDEYGTVFRLFCKTNPETGAIIDFKIAVSPKGDLYVRKW